jgi:hypothetical protein
VPAFIPMKVTTPAATVPTVPAAIMATSSEVILVSFYLI